MSVEVIRNLQSVVEEAESRLSDAIHKTYKPDTKVDWQVGTFDSSSWEHYVVVGPCDKYKITIRDRTGKTFTHDLIVDGRSYRLRLTRVMVFGDKGEKFEGDV